MSAFWFCHWEMLFFLIGLVLICPEGRSDRFVPQGDAHWGDEHSNWSLSPAVISVCLGAQNDYPVLILSVSSPAPSPCLLEFLFPLSFFFFFCIIPSLRQTFLPAQPTLLLEAISSVLGCLCVCATMSASVGGKCFVFFCMISLFSSFFFFAIVVETEDANVQPARKKYQEILWHTVKSAG